MYNLLYFISLYFLFGCVTVYMLLYLCILSSVKVRGFEYTHASGISVFIKFQQLTKKKHIISQLLWCQNKC